MRQDHHTHLHVTVTPHDIMAARLAQLRWDFEQLSVEAAETKGLTGWALRRAVKKMMETIRELETEMAKHDHRTVCPHGIHLDHCTMPTCIETKAGIHYRANRTAAQEARRLRAMRDN